MGDVIQLNRFRTAPDPSVPADHVQRDPWVVDLLAAMEEDMASSDLHYMCVNRGSVMRAVEIVREMEAVIPKPPTVMHLSDPFTEARIAVLNMPMRRLIEEITHSSHVTWLSQPHHYAAIVSEFYRRWEAHDRLIGRLTDQ